MLFFKKKKKEPIEKDDSIFKVQERLDLKPYQDLKYDLIYAHNEILVDNDDVIIACRKYKNVMLKFMLVNDFTKLNEYSLKNEKLLEYADKKGFFEYIKKEDIDSNKEIEIFIFKEKTEEIKKYCFISSLSEKNIYIQNFIYDHENGQLMSYRKLKDFGLLYEHYQTALYFDLACVDKEMY